mgnify:CR=1 FL=1
MTAEKATAQEATRKDAFAKVLAIQIIAYVVLVALALVPGFFLIMNEQCPRGKNKQDRVSKRFDEHTLSNLN